MEITIPKLSLPGDNGKAPLPADSEPANGQELYKLWDQRDENQIVEALKGRYLGEFVYEFCKRHKWPDGVRTPECRCADVVTGLSWLGVQEAAREYKGIMVPIEKIRKSETPEAIEIMAEALDTRTGSSRIGVAVQGKMMKLKTGSLVEDEFALSKALAKAQRNAIRPLLPVTLIKAWIEAHRTTSSGNALPGKEKGPAEPRLPLKETQPPPAQPAQPPAPRPSPRRGYPSESQVKRIFGLARGAKVSKDKVLRIIKAVAGVEKPELIPDRMCYERICAEIENSKDVPF